MIRTEIETRVFIESSVIRDTLYHGTTLNAARAIMEGGFDPTRSDNGTVDLSRSRKVAEDWARIRASNLREIPAVILTMAKIEKLWDARLDEMFKVIDECRIKHKDDKFTVSKYLRLYRYDAASLDFPFSCPGNHIVVENPTNVFPINYEQI